MAVQLDSFQNLGKDHVDASLKTISALTKGLQEIATELADYSRKSFEESNATFEKLVAAKSLDKALEIHTTYLKTAYENFVAESTRIGEIYTDVAKEAFRPYEGIYARRDVEQTVQ